jgi:glycosyltransferase involved in cell wall biosynthesis
MKILVVNRNYFITGGPEKYMFSLMESMTDHQFIPFAVDFEQNYETPYRKYFLAPPGDAGSVYFNEFRLSISQKIRFAIDMIYYRSAREKLENLIRETKPDIALFLNAVHFSDSIIDACLATNVPIIWRLSDFHKICASYLLFKDNHICELCLEKGLFQGVANRCGGYQRSLGIALIKYAGMRLSRIRSSYDHVRYFIAPSQFTRSKMIQGGFKAENVICVPSFVNTEGAYLQPCPQPHKILYVGRISPEKGVNILIDAFRYLRNKQAILTIVGDTNNPYAQSLIATLNEDLKTRIHFTGYKNQEDVAQLYRNHSFFVVPSLCYENQPNVVLEGMANARPAIVSCLGSMIEAVRHGQTGYHFTAAAPQDLADKMDALIDNPMKAHEMGMKAYEYVREYHSLKKHVSALESLFQSCVN